MASSTSMATSKSSVAPMLGYSESVSDQYEEIASLLLNTAKQPAAEIKFRTLKFIEGI